MLWCPLLACDREDVHQCSRGHGEHFPNGLLNQDLVGCYIAAKDAEGPQRVVTTRCSID